MAMLTKDTALAFCKDFYRCHKMLNIKVRVSGPYIDPCFIYIDLFDGSLTLMKDHEGKILVTSNDQPLLDSNEYPIVKDIYNACAHPLWYTKNHDEFNPAYGIDAQTKENILTNMIYNYPNRDFSYIRLSDNRYEIHVVNQVFIFVRDLESKFKYYFKDPCHSNQNFFYSPEILSKIWKDIEN